MLKTHYAHWCHASHMHRIHKIDWYMYLVTRKCIAQLRTLESEVNAINNYARKTYIIQDSSEQTSNLSYVLF